MKRIITVASLSAATLCTAAASADPIFPDGTYIRAFGGVTSGLSGGDMGSGPTSGLALGRSFDGTRYELELSRRSSDLDLGGERDVDAVMINVYRDLDGLTESRRLTPYVGAGLGALRLSAAGDSETGAAVQVMSGLRYDIGGSAALSGELRYTASDARVTGPTGQIDADGLGVVVGLELDF